MSTTRWEVTSDGGMWPSPVGDVVTYADHAEAIATLTAQLAEARAMVGAVIEYQRWRQMDTAPRDGTWFYAMTASGYTRKVHYADHNDRLPICGGGEVWSTLPILWRALDPDATTALAEYVRPLQDEVTRLREGLRFYKDAWKFKTNKRLGGLEWSPTEELLDDCGNKARALLEGDKP